VNGSQRGFTLIGLVLVLFLLTVGLGVVVLSGLQMVTGERESVTKDKLDKLKKAMIGNPNIISNQLRESFGYLGSMGGLPTKLEDLWLKGSWPDYTYDTVLKVGAGWVGPYLDVGTDMNRLKLDEWGTELEYISTQYTKPDGTVVSARIRSAGPDKVFNTADDYYVEILKNEAFATVSGYVSDKRGNPGKYLTVTLNLPQNGVISKLYAQTDVNGLFTIPNVPFGVRAFTVDPKIIYSEGSAQVTGGSYQNVTFSISNFGFSDITITSVQFNYPVTAYYEKALVAGKTVFDYTKITPQVRNGSGNVIDFRSQPVTLKGTYKLYPPTTLMVQLPVVTTPDVIVGTVGGGTTIQISAQNFKAAPTGSAALVNMNNVPFTVTFNDGSVIAFTPVP
jgi:hypothetical protein